MLTLSPVTTRCEPPNNFALTTTAEKSNGFRNQEILEENKTGLPADEVDSKKSTKFQVSFLVLLVIYTLFGAWIFQLLESDNELETLGLRRNLLTSGRLKLIRAVENIYSNNSLGLQINEKSSAALDAVHNYEYEINSILEGRLRIYLNETERPIMTWGSFLHSYFFVLVLSTTIGYGDLTPMTTWGRIFCITFSLIGIPLALIFIAQTGKLLAQFSSSWYKKLCSDRAGPRLFTSKPASSYFRKMIGTSASVLTVLIVVFSYMGIGACLFNATEQWGFINSLYFCFITLTTVGFGDLVVKAPAPGDVLGSLFIITRIIYGTIGLAITATAIQLVQGHYADIWTAATEVDVKRSICVQEYRSGCRCRSRCKDKCKTRRHSL